MSLMGRGKVPQEDLGTSSATTHCRADKQRVGIVRPSCPIPVWVRFTRVCLTPGEGWTDRAVRGGVEQAVEDYYATIRFWGSPRAGWIRVGVGASQLRGWLVRAGQQPVRGVDGVAESVFHHQTRARPVAGSRRSLRRVRRARARPGDAPGTRRSRRTPAMAGCRQPPSSSPTSVPISPRLSPTTKPLPKR
jgi:hypothetical protein